MGERAGGQPIFDSADFTIFLSVLILFLGNCIRKKRQQCCLFFRWFLNLTYQRGVSLVLI